MCASGRPRPRAAGPRAAPARSARRAPPGRPSRRAAPRPVARRPPERFVSSRAITSGSVRASSTRSRAAGSRAACAITARIRTSCPWDRGGITRRREGEPPSREAARRDVEDSGRRASECCRRSAHRSDQSSSLGGFAAWRLFSRPLGSRGERECSNPRSWGIASRSATTTGGRQLRAQLLDAQIRCAKAEFPVVVVCGADGGGQGDIVNLLLEWMDPRHIQVHAVRRAHRRGAGAPADVALLAALPPKGKTGVFFGSWYTRPSSAGSTDASRGRA